MLLVYEPETEAPESKYVEAYSWTPEQVESLHAAMDTDRVLATILFTDIVDSTGRAAAMGDRAWRRLLDRHDEITRAEVERWHGQLVKSTGDGCLATFDAPTRALRCAFALRGALARQGLDIRAAIHTGEVELRGTDLGGIGLHIAARALSEAGERQIVVTRTVRELATGTDLEFALARLGRPPRHPRPMGAVRGVGGAGMNGTPLRVGIVGCGDVASRHYLPALRSMGPRVAVAALSDPRPGAAEALAAAVGAAVPGPRLHRDVAEMVGAGGLDAVFDLAPAPAHGAVNHAILDAGLACYSEKPLAGSLADADGLIELARARDVPFLVAPGSAVTHRMRWLRGLVDSGRLGTPTLAVAHHADPGPAAWREYTGDPTPFYREGVGPVFDHGVYRLHEMTFLLGPVRRVQAMGAIGRPTRRVLGGPLTGRTIEVTTPDHVLIHLEFASGALGQLLASFGTSDTLAPWLELHLTRGSVSFGGKSWERDAPVSVYTDDDTDAAREGWAPAADAPVDDPGTVEAGALHFLRCLQGEEAPALTAEHARHVLDIILKAYASVADGASHETETTFPSPG